MDRKDTILALKEPTVWGWQRGEGAAKMRKYNIVC